MEGFEGTDMFPAMDPTFTTVPCLRAAMCGMMALSCGADGGEDVSVEDTHDLVHLCRDYNGVYKLQA